jgi:hypothetical protein
MEERKILRRIAHILNVREDDVPNALKKLKR